MEEGSEFLERLQSGGKLPMMTSCCPGWVNAVEQFHPDMIENLSTCRSPMSMMSPLIKTYFAEKKGIDPNKIFNVAIMPCTAKKSEADRDALALDENPLTDVSLTTRELAWMIKSAGIDFVNIEGEAFDKPLGMSSGAATIFGVTGGVMEAAIRTAYELYTGETLIDIELEAIRGFNGIKEGFIQIDGKEIRVAVAHGLGNAHRLLDMVRSDPQRYHFIEVMACPGGCIDGGGQPLHHGNADIIKARWEAIYEADRSMPIRKSHENPSVITLYKEFLGEPCGHKSHELLHTHYFDKQKVIEVKVD